ncbi:YggS family pyridoxal phosphate-dependent enzyme [Maritalea sp.]|uniref:YggS family pyridoxal phosphate-dependent enzyme n=1 Tax=Maritalea sp. TaxID=2003361 RepID=UPI003EF61339
MGIAQLEDVRERIELSAKRFGDDGAKPAQLIVVSKTFGIEEIEPIVMAGQKHFGENRVQEAQSKWVELKARHDDIVLHLIGPLQTNKVKDAVALFDVIQTVDREKLAKALAREFANTGENLPVMVQVNIGEEPQKAGIAPNEAVTFVELCRQTYGLKVVGLMCIPPAGQPPAPYFAQLVGLGEKADVKELSMGMSSDFDTAVEMGATYVRVGSAIFGDRDYPAN